MPPTFDVTRANTGLRQWDSVAHLQLVVALEDGFSIRLNPADVVELRDYRTAIAILRRHGVPLDA